MGRLGLVDAKSALRRRAWPGAASGRSTWARYVAPALFLLAVTGVVLAVRAGLRSDEAPSKATPAAGTTRSAPPGRQQQPKPSTPKRWYVIQSGDTLGAIASRLGTSVAALLGLNPGVEPTALTPGERIRVR